MFAVLKTGGKQYKVAKNDVIKVEKLDRNIPSEAGSVVVLDEVFAYNDGKKTTIGAPVVKNISVSAEVIEQKRDDKIIVFKKNRRHNYRRKKGHRQDVVFLRVLEIGEGLKAKKAPKAVAEKKETAVKKTAEKSPAKKTEAVAPKKAAPKAKAPAKKAEAKSEEKK